jgi:hypothetical protein
VRPARQPFSRRPESSRGRSRSGYSKDPKQTSLFPTSKIQKFKFQIGAAVEFLGFIEPYPLTVWFQAALILRTPSALTARSFTRVGFRSPVAVTFALDFAINSVTGSSRLAMRNVNKLTETALAIRPLGQRRLYSSMKGRAFIPLRRGLSGLY